MSHEDVVVRFACHASNCSCETVAIAAVTVSDRGGRLYEYNESCCSKCGHQLFRTHQMTGEAALPR